MARDNILLTYVGLDILFVSTGALLIIFALNNQAETAKEFTKDTVVRDLLLGMCPLNGTKTREKIPSKFSINPILTEKNKQPPSGMPFSSSSPF